jgi:hypothetical protein
MSEPCPGGFEAPHFSECFSPFRYCSIKGCGRSEDPPGWWAHVVGPGSRLRRCDPANSGQPYGREAAPWLRSLAAPADDQEDSL